MSMRRFWFLLAAGGIALASAGPALGHVHSIVQDNPNAAKPGVQTANGQNHPGFVDVGGGLIASCAGVAEPANSGPSWYGMETAHHGPEVGDPGRGDGCYVNVDDAAPGLRPPDSNPAIN
jgi:hypothetical protein